MRDVIAMPSSERVYNVAIIGAGRIAAGFDSPDSEEVLTHAHAFSKNPRTRLSGFFDVDRAKARAEAARWKTEAFESLEALLEHAPDVVVIATPDETHADLLRKLNERRVSLIVCEKPVATNRDELAALASLRTPVIVNFRRRFDPTVVALRQDLVRGEHGRIITAVGSYSKGLLHNGSHLIDLARFLFGEMTSHLLLANTNDWSGGNTVSAFLSFERCEQFHLVAGDERAYSLFELDVLTEKRRFRFTDEGFALTTERAVPDPVFKGFTVLGNPQREKTALMQAMKRMAAHVVEVLEDADPVSSLRDAMATQEACFCILGDK